MTVAAAAICLVRPAGAARPEEALIAISDRMLTSGDVGYESDLSKVYGISNRIVAIGAGEIDTFFALATETRRAAEHHGVADVATVAQLFAENFARLRTCRAEAQYLSTQGLDLSTFISRQQEMAPELTNDIYQRLFRERLEVQAIIAGVDSTGAHIYSVGGPPGQEVCHETCHDGGGFWAIGSGERQFATEFLFVRYSRFWGFVPALLLMCRAKRRAEVSPGVGRGTDMYVVETTRGGFEVNRETIARLDGYLDEYINALRAPWAAAVGRVINDPVLFPRPEPQQEQIPAEPDTTTPPVPDRPD